MTDELTNAERRRFNDVRERVIECINELVDDGYQGHEIYIALADRMADILIEGVPDMAERSVFVDMFRNRTIMADA